MCEALPSSDAELFLLGGAVIFIAIIAYTIIAGRVWRSLDEYCRRSYTDGQPERFFATALWPAYVLHYPFRFAWRLGAESMKVKK